MDVVVWLRSLGVAKYEAAFRDNEVDDSVLRNLTAEDLKELERTAWADKDFTCTGLKKPVRAKCARPRVSRLPAVF